ncbi:MAG: alginate O-acetyltransferase complex protein AlgI, partial [Bradymonadia bacterium]
PRVGQSNDHMLFNSLIFAAFLPLCFVLYWGIGQRNWRMQNGFLALASYAFYAAWDWRFLGLIVFSSVVDFALGLRLAASDDRRERRAILGLSLTVNLGLLLYFKYANFFVDSAITLLNGLGVHVEPLTLNIILPMGISFYTFQTLSYTIDIYRRELEPTRDFVAFAAFVSFFPQLVAGPIERARRLLPQFHGPREFDPSLAADGLRQMLWGYVKKVLIADNLAPFVELCFDAQGPHDSITRLIGAVLFTVQLYCDFSGYSDMAIGMARFFGVDLMRNFAYPFFARSAAELWRRWHISLSSWFRDYVFIPLGGSRVSLTRNCINVLIVFGISGLWHGATWAFVFWGLLNGLYLLPGVIRGTKPPTGTVAEGRWLPRPGELYAMTQTFALWGFSLIFFRARHMDKAGPYVSDLFTAGYNPAANHAQFIAPLLMCLGLLLWEWCTRMAPHGLQPVRAWPRPARWTLYAGLALILIVFGNASSREFVYFQF